MGDMEMLDLEKDLSTVMRPHGEDGECYRHQYYMWLQ